MKIDRQWYGWRRLERIALWSALAICLYIAAQPLRDRLTAWNSQRLLEARWQEARDRTRLRPQSTNSPLPQAKKDGHLLSWHRPPKPRAKTSAQEEQPLWPLTRLSYDKITLDAIVVEGTGESQLRSGPGHEIGTSWPGGPNCVIAAHRNAFGWWFYSLNHAKPGDSIVLQVPDRKYIYRVVGSRIVSVQDTSILGHHGKTPPRLTLYTCTLPKTRNRLVVTANLLRSEPI